MTKFSCEHKLSPECLLTYEKEIEIFYKHAKFFTEKEPMPVLCSVCKQVDDDRKVIEKADKLIQTLPKKYRYLEDKYDMQPMVDANKYNSLYLYGETGAGKTVIATMILKELWYEGKGGRFLEFPEFMNSCLNNFDAARTQLNVIKSYPDCLVIDDLGAERTTDYSRNLIYILITYREGNNLQTIITSNYNIKQLDGMIDTRISSRIAGMCEIIELEGDKRIKKQSTS